MIKKIEGSRMGSSNLGWLQSKFHFSFADYYNPLNMHFGVLRVINDDLIAPNTGFDMHSHKNMEIISYVVNGALTHEDSMGNVNTIQRGHVQYMSAGSGIFHSEYNHSNQVVRLLQIWILPAILDIQPNYGDYRFAWDLRKNKWLHMVSNEVIENVIKINQDANIYALELAENNLISFDVANNRQAYLVLIEGKAMVNGIYLKAQDALEAVGEKIDIKAQTNTHFLLIEMPKA